MRGKLNYWDVRKCDLRLKLIILQKLCSYKVVWSSEGCYHVLWIPGAPVYQHSWRNQSIIITIITLMIYIIKFDDNNFNNETFNVSGNNRLCYYLFVECLKLFQIKVDCITCACIKTNGCYFPPFYCRIVLYHYLTVIIHNNVDNNNNSNIQNWLSMTNCDWQYRILFFSESIFFLAKLLTNRFHWVYNYNYVITNCNFRL